MKKGLLLAILVVAGLSAAPPKVKAQQSTTVYPGTATLQTASLTSTTCPGSGCLTFTVTSWGSAAIQLSGTWSATVAFQGSLDGTNYQSIACSTAGSTTGALATGATANGLWLCPSAGMTYFRVVATAFTSGPISVNARPTWMNAGMSHGSGSSSSSTIPWINVKDYGATGDGVTNDHAAVAAAIAAMPNQTSFVNCGGNPCPHTTGSILYFPAGTYWLGSSSTTGAISISASYFTMRGDGIDTTHIKFQSVIPSYPGDGITNMYPDDRCAGQGICVYFNRFCGNLGLCDWDVFRDVNFEDFTLEDTNTDRAFIFNLSSADSVLLSGVVDARVSRVKCINCKGNAPLSIYGRNCTSVSCSYGGNNLIIEDFQCLGVIDWDCINAMNFRTERYSRNIFMAEWNPTYMSINNAIEGGGMPDQFIDPLDNTTIITAFPHHLIYEDNYVSSQTMGGLQINAGDDIWVRGNYADMAGRGIYLNSETGGNASNYTNVHIENNTIYGNHTGTRGVYVTGIPGTTPIGMLSTSTGNVFIAHNIIQSILPIDIQTYTSGVLMIQDNRLDDLGNDHAINASNTTVTASNVTISGNTVESTRVGGAYILDWTSAGFPAAWKSHGVRWFNNNTSNPIDNNVGTTNGASVLGAWVVATNTPTAVAGTSSSVTTVTVTGALVGDDITVRMATELPQDVYLRARVTSGDTLSYWIQNQSGTNYDGTGVGLKIMVERRR